MKDSFRSLGLSEATLSAVTKIGYDIPTPVQAKAIPAALKGRDVVVGAKTGTGKTAAFALPIIDRLDSIKKKKNPAVLILSPTRELAQQTDKVLTALTKDSRVRTVTIIGGVSYQGQISQLRRGVDIVVATPGRLQDIVEQGAVNLDDIGILVLDEADRMLDMGFWPAIKQIISEIPEDRQTMLFSATIDKKALKKISGVLRDPLTIEISQRGETVEEVDQFVVPVEQRSKPQLLQSILEKYGSSRVIVFTRTKRRSDSCAQQLCKAGFSAEAIHSEKSQRQRQRSLENFAKGRTGILVATDVLARGIDVTDVESVINYDLPDSPDDYVHRIGRTGRAGGSGNAISFVSADTRSNLSDIERLVGKKIPSMKNDLLNTIITEEKFTRSKPSSENKSARTGNKTSNGPRSEQGKKSAYKGEGAMKSKKRNKSGEKNTKPSSRKNSSYSAASKAAR